MRLVSILASTTLLAALSTSTQAAWQSIPGAACSPMLGQQTTQFNKVNETGLARVGSGSAWISCPLHRTMFIRQVIYVNFNHPTTRETLCKITRSDYATGAMVSLSATARGTGNVYAGFNVNNSALGTMNTYDTYSVSCNVAQGTTIRGVSWQDN